MILPAFGVVSEIITCFARKRIFGYTYMVYSILTIAVLGFLVWGHHMFVSGQSMYASMVFSILTYLVAVPSAIKVFNWTATLYKGSISFEAPMLYALGFVGLFLNGGLTGLFVGATALDVHLSDTYFVIAHFHYVMVGGTVMAYLGGIHFWWSKVTGRMYPEWIAQFAAMLMFFGFNLTFFPQYLLGYLGMPRRYHEYLGDYQVLNVLSSAGASILAVAYLLPLCYLTWSLFYGRTAPANPWRAAGLEWQISSPPPEHNFEKTPVVRQGPYDYASQDRTAYSAQNG
jgi:cytochrome c oxidase subunit 1